MKCPIVTCKDGKVSGLTLLLKSNDAKPVYCYRNVPFAKPPIGNLRFMSPQPGDPWPGVRNGTILGKIPIQDIGSPKVEEPYFPQKISPGEEEDLSEDCLHLTIYTTKGEQERKPVMVWFYGGSFQDGSERLYDGSALSGIHDVVVVIPNYRLNVFGFFSMGKGSLCPGNAGLQDQNMALRWVQRNIGAFGGDPENVTIFGESAGAMSVNHHVNSPLSRDLFHRAISHSGQSSASPYVCADVRFQREAFLDELGITEKNPEKILNALQSITAQKLREANKAVLEKYSWRGMFVPCVDGVFLTKSAEQSLREGDFAKVPYIIGCNSSECHGGMPMCIFGEDLAKGITVEQFKEGSYIPVSDGDIGEWRNFYIKNQQDELALSKLYCRVMGDRIFVIPAITTASKMADSNNVYFYHCCYQPHFSHDEKFGPKEGIKPSWYYCDHGDDLHMMLGVPFTSGELRLGGKFAREEEELSQKCMTYITNFAKHGDPNKGKNVEVLWPKYKPGGDHIILDHNIDVGSNLAAKRYEYWKNYLEK